MFTIAVRICSYIAYQVSYTTPIVLRASWSPVYCSYTNVCGYATRLSVPPGTHRVRHVDADGKFMVFAYGFEYHDGYGQIGGVDMDWILFIQHLCI